MRLQFMDAARLQWRILVMGCLGVVLLHCKNEENWIREAAARYCKRQEQCWIQTNFYQHYSSVEGCTEGWASVASFPDPSETCPEAHVGYLECWAELPCDAPFTSCDAAFSVYSYECFREENLSSTGVFCGDQYADRDECDSTCTALSRHSPFVWYMCVEETPEYCECGTETCNVGEYCCYCPAPLP